MIDNISRFFTMNLTSFYFFITLSAIFIIYYIVPKKVQWLVILCANTVFIFANSGLKGFLVIAGMFFSIWIATHLFETFSEKPAQKKQTLIFILCINAGLLLLLKDAHFFARILGLSKESVHVKLLQSLAPIGISYWTLSLIAYLLDCYWGKIKPESSFLKFTAYASFFPLLLSGPIIRYNESAEEILKGHKFSYENFCAGAQRFLWGIFKKLVLAERFAIIASTIYNGGTAAQMETVTFKGFYILIGTVAFVFQLYTDFSGCMDMVLGIAEMLGIKLPENFTTPFYSTSVAEFWRRWHITLGAWLRDYIYIPLGGSRKGKIRKYINIMIVFLISGFWHGGTFKFLAWGFLFGAYQIIGDATLPFRKNLCEKLGINRECFSFKLWQRIVVFASGIFAWVFFRATSLREALHLLKNMFSCYNPWIFVDGSLFKLGLDANDFFVMIFGMMILFFVSKKQQQGSVRKIIATQNIAFRWLLWLGLFAIVLVFGMYGEGYNAADFIYGGF